MMGRYVVSKEEFERIAKLDYNDKDLVEIKEKKVVEEDE